MIPSLLSISLICGCMPSMAFIFLATNEWLSIIKSLKDSSGKSFLDVLNSSSLGNSGGFIVSGFGLKGGVESSFEVRDKLVFGHGFELNFLRDEFTVVVVVVSGSDGSNKSAEFH